MLWEKRGENSLVRRLHSDTSVGLEAHLTWG